MEKIKCVIDRYFDFMEEIGSNSFIEELIPEELINSEKEPKYERTKFWKPIISTITNNDIEGLEEYYGCKLPNSYKFFLRYRHFLELNLGQYSISFFKSLPKSFVQNTIEEIEDNYENLIKRNFIPFAHMSDYGVLCFKVVNSDVSNDYEIVSFDHEDDFENPEQYSNNFESMFIEFENHLNEWIKNRREKNTT